MLLFCCGGDVSLFCCAAVCVIVCLFGWLVDWLLVFVCLVVVVLFCGCVVS